MDNSEGLFDDLEVVETEQEEELRLKELETLQSERNKRFANEFMIHYQELVKKYGFQIVAEPVFVMSRDGTFGITIELLVGKVQNGS